MILLSGTANPALSRLVAERLGVPLAPRVLERFPDGELHVTLEESVRGEQVFLLQPTSPPVEAHLFEVLLLADAARRAGARRRTAVIPYFGYARQDRRAGGRDPIGARVAADVLAVAGVDAVVVVDLHSRATEGFFSTPAEHLSAVPILADALGSDVERDTVVVAPDLGAAKLADRYGAAWNVPVATVHKTRLSGRDVKVDRIVGDVRDRAAILVDDMITTGGTVAAAVRALVAGGARPGVTVVATHGVFAGRVEETLGGLPIRRIVTTDSVASPVGLALPLRTVTLAPLLAEAIGRLDRDESLGGLISHR